MNSLRLDTVNSILCIGAHADDIEIGCGGTILSLLKKRNDLDIRWVVLSGNQIRAAEARSSAECFLAGARTHQVEIASFQDACFPYSDAMATKKYFGELSQSYSPDLIFTHRRDDAHQDHRFVADLTWQHFRENLILEYEIPKYEGDLDQPSVFVPLGKEAAEAKIEMIVSEFQSQHDKQWFDPDAFRSLHRIRGIECQSQSGFAEAFHCRKLLLGV